MCMIVTPLLYVDVRTDALAPDEKSFLHPTQNPGILHMFLNNASLKVR
jgi:hypothetical protein